jgi:hypothetical protein
MGILIVLPADGSVSLNEWMSTEDSAGKKKSSVDIAYHGPHLTDEETKS